MDNTTLNAVKEALLKQPEILANEYKRIAKEERKDFLKSLNKSNITDKKLIKILEERESAEGSYKERIDKLLKDYVKEKNIQGDQLNELNLLMEKSNKIAEIQKKYNLEQRKREQRENPLVAFKHSLEDLKESNKEKGFYDVKSSVKTLGKGLLEGFNLKTISKGLIHGAGVLFDNPALNILADKISTSIQVQEVQNQREFEFINELEELNKNNEKSTKSESKFKNTAEETKEKIDNVKTELSDGLTSGNIKPVIDKLNSIEGNTESTYIDLGSTLENIKDELEKQTSIYKEQLFIQKDLANEPSNISSIVDYKKTAIAKKPDEEESSENDFGILGNIVDDLFDKKSKKSKGGLKNAAKGLTAIATSIARVAGPIALVTGAVVSVYEGVKGFQEAGKNFDLDSNQIATTSQKLTSSISSIVDALTFGLLDEKVIANKIDNMTSTLTSGVKKILGQYDTSDKITDELEKQNILDKSLLGNSEIRDWDKIKDLKLDQLEAVYNYNDWDKKTEEKLRSLIRSKKKELNKGNIPTYAETNISTPTISVDKINNLAELNKEAISSNVSKMSNEEKANWYKERGYDTSTGRFIDKEYTPIKSSNNETNVQNLKEINNVTNEKLPEPKSDVQTVTPNVTVQAPPVQVINKQSNERKIDNLNLTDKDAATLVSILGIGK